MNECEGGSEKISCNSTSPRFALCEMSNCDVTITQENIRLKLVSLNLSDLESLMEHFTLQCCKAVCWAKF